MQTAQLDKMRERLLKMQARVEGELLSSEEARVEQVNATGDLSNHPTHKGDHDSEGFDAEIAVNQTLRQQLDEVHDALQRIEEGTYGICTRCGQEISAARLDALPQTPVCIDCARETEAEGGEA